MFSDPADDDQATSRYLVVDAANVIGSRPDGWWRDRAGAVRRMLSPLGGYAADHPELSIVVVVEGKAKPVAHESYEPIRVVAAPRSGDDRIIELVEEFEGEISVVTADRELSRLVQARGADIIRPGQFWSMMPE